VFECALALASRSTSSHVFVRLRVSYVFAHGEERLLFAFVFIIY